MRISLAGCGLIGKERIKAISNLKKKGCDIELVGVYDPEHINSNVYNFINEDDIFNIHSNDSSDWIFIATQHDEAFRLAKKALDLNYNVFMEKPMGRNLEEAQILYNSINSNKLYVGMNYRFYNGISRLLQDVKGGKFGNIISINIVLGHGCHPNIDKGWKLDYQHAGGGCLLDPGIHLIDLCNIMSNNILDVEHAISYKGFWNTGIEEESNVMFKCDGYYINMNVSIVKWRSTFKIEVNGTDGYGIVEGRDKSYGNQIYYRGERWGWQKGLSQKNTEIVICDKSNDDVFEKEIENLYYGGTAVCSAKEALANMYIYNQIKIKERLC